MDDFIVIYTYPYKGYFEEMSERYNQPDEKSLAYALSKFLEKVEATMLFSGIDHKSIYSEVSTVKGKTLYETLSSLKVKAIAKKYSTRKELNETAETYVLFSALKLHDLHPFPSPELISKEFSLNIKPSPFLKKQGIGIMLRFEDWVVIKKLSYEDVEDYMIAGITAGIASSVAGKFYSLLGFDIPSKKSKSLKNLILSLQSIEKEKGIKQNYGIYKSFIENGYSPYATLEMLSKAYPSLKPKKPRGRLPK